MDLSLQALGGDLKERLLLPLPGGDAHESFRATPVGDVRPLFDHRLPPRPGGVLILLFSDGDRIKFPLIKRPEYPGAHGGQVSLPGGKAEAGEDAVDAALREAEEEIGIDRRTVTVIGKLSDFFVMPSNILVTPVIALTHTRPVFTPDPREVVHLLYGDLSEILMDDAIRQKEIMAAGKYRMLAPHFEIEGQIVWGATAMMLNELRLIVKEIMGEKKS